MKNGDIRILRSSCRTLQPFFRNVLIGDPPQYSTVRAKWAAAEFPHSDWCFSALCIHVKPGNSWMIAAVLCRTQRRDGACVCVCVCAHAWKRLGDILMAKKKLSSDFKGVSGHAALSQPSVDASSGWPCKFHHKYLWILLSSSNLSAYTFRFFIFSFLHLHTIFFQTKTTSSTH